MLGEHSPALAQPTVLALGWWLLVVRQERILRSIFVSCDGASTCRARAGTVSVLARDWRSPQPCRMASPPDTQAEVSQGRT